MVSPIDLKESVVALHLSSQIRGSQALITEATLEGRGDEGDSVPPDSNFSSYWGLWIPPMRTQTLPSVNEVFVVHGKNKQYQTEMVHTSKINLQLPVSIKSDYHSSEKKPGQRTLVMNQS